MQRRAKITSKGQVTIPQDIRELLGVGEGDIVVFEVDPEGVHVRPQRGESPFARYQGIGNPGIPGGREAINAYIREMRGHDE